MHVYPYIQLDPDSPFSERFKVSNDGFFSINDVDVRCDILEAKGTKSTVIQTILYHYAYRKVLQAGVPMTIDCPLDKITPPGNKWMSAKIGLVLGFKPDWYLWRIQKSVNFHGEIDSEGKLCWLY